MPLAFARHVYLYSATLISPGPRRRTRLSPGQSPDRRYSARSADRSTRHACCRRQFQLAGVARPTRPHLGSQGHFFSFAVYLFRREINERPTTLDRQRRTPTKGRIQNTPVYIIADRGLRNADWFGIGIRRILETGVGRLLETGIRKPETGLFFQGACCGRSAINGKLWRQTYVCVRTTQRTGRALGRGFGELERGIVEFSGRRKGNH